MLFAVSNSQSNKDSKAEMEGRELTSIGFCLLIPVISKTEYAKGSILWTNIFHFDFFLFQLIEIQFLSLVITYNKVEIPLQHECHLLILILLYYKIHKRNVYQNM